LRPPWNDDLVELLTLLWNENKHSAKWIAWQLGPQFTRNSVIGKANRLGLERKGYRNKVYYGWKHTQKPREPKGEDDMASNPRITGALNRPAIHAVTLPVITELPERASINVPVTEGEGMGYFEAGPEDCRYLLTGLDGAESIYDCRCCGKKVARGAYCAQHYKLCYMPIRGR
jgi:hypothetical protein